MPIYELQNSLHLLLHRCSLRFPSTNIRINFENLANQPFDIAHHTGHSKNSINSVENSNMIYSPLKISIPDGDKMKSPFPSPTGSNLLGFSVKQTNNNFLLCSQYRFRNYKCGEQLSN